MKKGLDLSAFVRLVNLEVERFQETYEKGMKEDKKNWPSSMNEADWWDQFIVFLETKEGKKVSRG